MQGSLERALSSLTGESIRVALAGRTDAGVHALGQVASFLTGSRHSPETVVRAVNALLPPDIAVRAAAETPQAFDPRRHAVGRWYRYTLCVGGARPALARQFEWHLPPLDTAAMRDAAAVLPGRHDFAAFTQPSEARRRRTEREVSRSALSGNGRRLRFDVEANAFLRQMVRRIAAALVEVGQGKQSPAGFEALLREAEPGSAARVAPARGLCLVRVRYENGLFDDETNEDI